MKIKTQRTETKRFETSTNITSSTYIDGCQFRQDGVLVKVNNQYAVTVHRDFRIIDVTGEIELQNGDIVYIRYQSGNTTMENKVNIFIPQVWGYSIASGRGIFSGYILLKNNTFQLISSPSTSPKITVIDGNQKTSILNIPYQAHTIKPGDIIHIKEGDQETIINITL